MSTYKPPQISFKYRNPLALCAQVYEDVVAGRRRGSTPTKATALWDALLKEVDIEIQPHSDMNPGQSYPLSVMSAPAGPDILAEEESNTKNAVTAPSSLNVTSSFPETPVTPSFPMTPVTCSVPYPYTPITYTFPETYLDNNNMSATSTSEESAVSTATPKKCPCPDCPKPSGH